MEISKLNSANWKVYSEDIRRPLSIFTDDAVVTLGYQRKYLRFVPCQLDLASGEDRTSRLRRDFYVADTDFWLDGVYYEL